MKRFFRAAEIAPQIIQFLSSIEDRFAPMNRAASVLGDLLNATSRGRPWDQALIHLSYE